MPVAVHLVDLGEVVERRVGRVDDVAPGVVPPVLLEVEAPAGAGNELPQPRGVRARIGKGIEGALHHGQERELGRQAALLDLFDDVIEVEAAAVEHALQVVRARCVFARLAPHERVLQVRHGESLPHALPQVDSSGRAVHRLDSAQRVLDFEALAVEGRQPRCLEHDRRRHRRRLGGGGWRRRRRGDCGRRSYCRRRDARRSGRRRRRDGDFLRRRGLRRRRRARAGLDQAGGEKQQQASGHRASR